MGTVAHGKALLFMKLLMGVKSAHTHKAAHSSDNAELNRRKQHETSYLQNLLIAEHQPVTNAQGPSNLRQH